MWRASFMRGFGVFGLALLSATASANPSPSKDAFKREYLPPDANVKVTRIYSQTWQTRQANGVMGHDLRQIKKLDGCKMSVGNVIQAPTNAVTRRQDTNLTVAIKGDVINLCK